MNSIKFSILFVILWFSVATYSQIENVRVETYYISDSDDATDLTGGNVEVGSTTYRIFIDLLPGSSIRSIYGSEHHPLAFSSTQPFYNHMEDGVTFGKDLNRNRYGLGTVPLDSYLTIGQCSKSFAQGAYAGVPKAGDHDGSVVGGTNNDGGSAGIASGLLKNAVSDLGIPLTIADGLITNPNFPDSWIDIGFKDILTDADTTIFGAPNKYSFYSTDALLRNSGVQGVDSLDNEVLIAHLTTKGELAFEINLEVEIFIDDQPHVVKYVARNEMLGEYEVFSPLLKFPYTCGCTDPEFLEASTTFACTDNSKCHTLIVHGCTDSLACNFNAQANVNLSELCCYVGFCHDLDISVACPDLKPRVDSDDAQVRLYPNPAANDLNIDLSFIQYNDITYRIHDLLGRTIVSGTTHGQDRQIDISNLSPGSYSIQMRLNEKLLTRPFIKL